MHDLVIDLGSLEGTGEPALSGGTEDAAHATARLSGDAHGKAIPRGHADALGLGAIGVAQQVLPASVA